MGITNYKRKLYFARFASSLININEDVAFKIKDNIPTLLFMNRCSLRAWLKLKDAIIDIGENYSRRINLYTQFVLFLMMVYLIFFMLVFFGFLSFTITPVVWCVGLMDITTCFSVIMIMINQGAKVNAHYDIDVGILLDIKHMLFDITKDPAHYKKMGKYETRLQ